MPSDEDWKTLLSFLPPDWEELASGSGALTRLRGFDSAEALLRVLLIHLAQGCSLRETAVRARRRQIASVSDVAILKRLRKSELWLRRLCLGVCEGVSPLWETARLLKRRIVAVHATCVSEPGSTGTNWRMHYALELASLTCLHFELTDASGVEQLERFAFRPGDLVLADRMYATSPGIRSVMGQQADVLVRLKLSRTPIYRRGRAQRFDFLAAAQELAENAMAQWEVTLGDDPRRAVTGRLCLMRRPEEIAQLERARMEREARKKGRTVGERTLRAASFVGLFTTLADNAFSTEECFRLYRFRWQIETAFKRLKTLTDFGHLPKHDPASCRAWLYGKLLVGLLAERMAQTAFFP